VVVPSSAHVHTDEAGAPERMAGLKLLTVPTPDGRLTPELVAPIVAGGHDVHFPQPSVVAIAQATELGTVYTPDQIAALAEQAHGLGLRLYLDGARLANAAAHLGLPLRALTTDVGVDVVGLGGTKNGLMFGEIVVVLDQRAVDGLPYVRKMHAQLASKSRFAAAQLLALYEGDLWLRSARHANAMAALLAAGLAEIPGVHLVHPVEANAVFACLPAATVARLRERWAFYDWTPDGSQVRLMCAWDTTEQDVEDFLTVARAS
jgi:threonine aldolase